MTPKSTLRVLAILFFVAVIGIVWLGVDRGFQAIENYQAQNQPDAPEVAEIIGGFNGVVSAFTAGNPNVNCNSSVQARTVAVGGVEAMTTELETLAAASRELLASKHDLSAKDRQLLATKSAAARTAIGAARSWVTGMQACSGDGVTSTRF